MGQCRALTQPGDADDGGQNVFADNLTSPTCPDWPMRHDGQVKVDFDDQVFDALPFVPIPTADIGCYPGAARRLVKSMQGECDNLSTGVSGAGMSHQA